MLIYIHFKRTLVKRVIQHTALLSTGLKETRSFLLHKAKAGTETIEDKLTATYENIGTLILLT